MSLTALWVTIMHFEKNNISDLKCEKCGRDEKKLDEKGRNYINKNYLLQIKISLGEQTHFITKVHGAIWASLAVHYPFPPPPRLQCSLGSCTREVCPPPIPPIPPIPPTLIVLQFYPSLLT